MTLETMLKSRDFPVDKIYMESRVALLSDHLGWDKLAVIRSEPYNGDKDTTLYTLRYLGGVFFQVVEGFVQGKTTKLSSDRGDVLVQRFNTTELYRVRL